MSLQGMFKRGDERMFEGNSFQSVRAVTEKALSLMQEEKAKDK